MDRNDQPEPPDSPAPRHSIIDTPATVRKCEDDYAARNTAPSAGQHTATPHTLGHH